MFVVHLQIGVSSCRVNGSYGFISKSIILIPSKCMYKGRNVQMPTIFCYSFVRLLGCGRIKLCSHTNMHSSSSECLYDRSIYRCVFFSRKLALLRLFLLPYFDRFLLTSSLRENIQCTLHLEAEKFDKIRRCFVKQRVCYHIVLNAS